MLPLLKYPGGKRKLVSILSEAFDSACTRKKFSARPLDERFFGSGALSFGLEHKEVFANDICSPVMAFHRQVATGLDLESIDFSNTKENYLANRARFNQLLKQGKIYDNEAAGLLYFLNRSGFNGVIRFSEKSGFNISFGRYSRLNHETNFDAWQKLSSRWTFSDADFEAHPVSDGAAIFIDSPYDSLVDDNGEEQISLFDPLDVENVNLAGVPQGSGFVAYNGDSFPWGDQLRVVRFAISIPNPVVITNLATPRILALYERYGFFVKTHNVSRSVNRDGQGRGKVKEVIAIKKESKR